MTRTAIRMFFLLLVIGAGNSAVLAKDGDMENQLKTAVAAGELPGLHSVIALQDGKVLAEVYFRGKDENWGRSLGLRDHGPGTLHDLRSVTKSITSLLYGIALSDSLVPGLDDSLVAQFPDYNDLAADPARRKILIRHALSMKMGTAWNEDLPYTDPKNSEIAMELAPDRYRFVLDRPLVQKPGDWWTYNGGATAVIARLIAEGAGMSIDEYARQKLFAPLGITEFEWAQGRDGIASAASGLRLTARDLAKIGQMALQHGQYDGKQIVPADWLVASFTPHAKIGVELRYGFFWWLANDGTPPNWIAGFGNGGQRLFIHPGRRLVLVVFAGNYNDRDAWQVPVKVITDFLIPASTAIQP